MPLSWRARPMLLTKSGITSRLPTIKTAFKLYVNGKEEAAGDYAKDPETNDAPLRIGNGIDGIIDELQILSVALSVDEIQSDMNDGIQLSVEATGKATITWAYLKSQYKIN